MKTYRSCKTGIYSELKQAFYLLLMQILTIVVYIIHKKNELNITRPYRDILK
jgi:hypothetical protein